MSDISLNGSGRQAGFWVEIPYVTTDVGFRRRRIIFSEFKALNLNGWVRVATVRIVAMPTT